jgi:hypothetical protein
VKATIDELKEVNLGTIKDPCLIHISALLSPKEEEAYINLLKKFRDVFAWSYKEMSGLDPKIVVHYLVVRDRVAPVKQAQQHFRPELVPLIEVGVNKLIEAKFIREVKYPT